MGAVKTHSLPSFPRRRETIDGGGLLDVLSHPNQQKYPGQEIYVVRALGYVYLVPYIIDKERIFLKTIIPSRKAKNSP